jgi:hypothetical protein
MKEFKYLILLNMILASAQQMAAQDKPQDKLQEKTKTEEHFKPLIPIKVQMVFTEYDGDKKIASMPYSFIAVADEKLGGYYSTSVRNGVRIPVETDGKDQKTTYLDLGTNIDCGIRNEEDGRFHLYFIFERSSLNPSAAMGDEKLEVTRPNGLPLIRQMRTSETLVLKDGQSSESLLSTDPINGHSIRLSVTINVVK